MFENHYYLVISDQHRSTIIQAKSPTCAASIHSDGWDWHIREGVADLHYIGYPFFTSGIIASEPVDIVDLGPISVHDTPLMRHRVPKGLENKLVIRLLQA